MPSSIIPIFAPTVAVIFGLISNLLPCWACRQRVVLVRRTILA